MKLGAQLAKQPDKEMILKLWVVDKLAHGNKEVIEFYRERERKKERERQTTQTDRLTDIDRGREGETDRGRSRRERDREREKDGHPIHFWRRISKVCPNSNIAFSVAKDMVEQDLYRVFMTSRRPSTGFGMQFCGQP